MDHLTLWWIYPALLILGALMSLTGWLYDLAHGRRT